MRSFAQLITDVGAPLDSGFRRAGLAVSALESVDNYLPSQRFFAFILDSAAREGIDDIGFRVGRRSGANGADPRLVSRLRAAPTLYRAIAMFSALTQKTVTHSQLELAQPPGSEQLRFYHRPSCDIRHPVHAQIAWFEPFRAELPESLEQVLIDYAREHPLSVGLAADLFNTSPRTLQRRLKTAGTRFSDVIDRVHFAVASELLRIPGTKVADVARALNYSDPTHFSRAFRRIAGISPTTYRQRLLPSSMEDGE